MKQALPPVNDSDPATLAEALERIVALKILLAGAVITAFCDRGGDINNEVMVKGFSYMRIKMLLDEAERSGVFGVGAISPATVAALRLDLLPTPVSVPLSGPAIFSNQSWGQTH